MPINTTVKNFNEAHKILPLPFPETNDIPARGGRYGEIYTQNLIPTKHLLADEGSYFITNNAQTGLATAAAPTTFSATNPFLLIYNGDTVGNPNAKSIYLDYALLLATAAGTAGTNVQFAVTVDTTNRYSSAGTNITSNIVSPNTSLGVKSVASVYAGNITATAASPAVRTIIGNRFMKGAIPVVGDQYTIQFGGVDAPTFLGISTILLSTQNVAPIILGPGSSALIHIWLGSQSGASSYAPELAWWER